MISAGTLWWQLGPSCRAQTSQSLPTSRRPAGTTPTSKASGGPTGSESFSSPLLAQRSPRFRWAPGRSNALGGTNILCDANVCCRCGVTSPPHVPKSFICHTGTSPATGPATCCTAQSSKYPDCMLDPVALRRPPRRDRRRRNRRPAGTSTSGQAGRGLVRKNQRRTPSDDFGAQQSAATQLPDEIEELSTLAGHWAPAKALAAHIAGSRAPT